MEVFEVVIALLLGGAGAGRLSRRIGAPYPALVALAGAGLALIPGAPDAGARSRARAGAVRGARPGRRGVRRLAARPARQLAADREPGARRGGAHDRRRSPSSRGCSCPDMPWAAAVALGAIVAPPDAAAATRCCKQLRPPHRLLVILEGESLFNDASALLIYRLAVGATVPASSPAGACCRRCSCVTLGSVVLGLVLARITLAVNARIQDVSTAVVVQFCSAFGVWILAERLHLSGIITRGVRDGGVAPRARDPAGPHAHPRVGGVGSRGLRAERARVHPGGLPAQVDRGEPDAETARATPASRSRCAPSSFSRASCG